MISAPRMVGVVLSVLLLGAMGKTPESEPLPSACDTLRALPADMLVGQSLDYQTTQDRTGNDILMSMCTAVGDDGLPAVTLLLRQDISKTGTPTASAQRDTLIAELSDTFGHDPEATFPDIGEFAIWVADIGQLTVWYKAGRVMFIVTATRSGSEPDQDLAERIASGVTARFP